MFSTTTISTSTIRRLFTALALLLALSLSVSLASQANAASVNAKAAPQGAKHIKGKASKAEQKRLRSALKTLQSTKRAGLNGGYVTCDPYQRASWGYWIRCHVVTGNSGYSYFDGYYEYDYWTGSHWAYWFIANN